jgi:very-short-patch-repair endonuclease
MIAAFPAEFVSKLQRGRVTAIGVPAPASSLAELEDYVDQEIPSVRVVGLRLAKFSSHDHLLSGCVHGLASAAVALWPDWYGADVDAGKKGEHSKHVSPLWREQAEPLVTTGRIPLPSGYPHAVQVAQLALALGSPDLIVSLAVTEGPFTLERLKSLVATATWLAEQSHAKVALLVPQSALSSEEFDRVTRESLGQLNVTSLSEPPAEEIPAVTITSVKGRPNPTSPGEMILAERLGKNVELAGLFSFNQTLRSVHDKEYIVDLVWPDGKLIVEVDGYTFHNSPFAFGQDRHRDYELLISGYRVLRLTHEEIMKDTTRAIAKIRDSVHFLKKNSPHGA